MSELGGARVGLGKASSRLATLVCNNVVFTWAFVEMLVWFWVSSRSGCFVSSVGNVVDGGADLCDAEGREEGDDGEEGGETKNGREYAIRIRV